MNLWTLTTHISLRCSILLLLLSCIEKLDSAASTFDFNTVGIKEIVEQGAWDMHPGRDTNSDHAECAI